jgi:hypothetical protein
MRAVWLLFSFGVGCHLIGGAGDLTFDAQGGGGAMPGGSDPSGGGGNGGSGGVCAEACTGICMACDAREACVLAPAGFVCESGGACDDAGDCKHGNVVWQRLYGDTLDDGAMAIAVGEGRVFVGGFFTGDNLGMNGLNIDGTTHNTAGMIDGVAAALDVDNGDGVWATVTEPSDATQRIEALATDDNNNLIIGGTFQNTLIFGGSTQILNDMPANFVDVDPFVMKINRTNGLEIWTWASTNHPALPPEAPQFVDAVAASTGHIAVAGHGQVGIEWEPGTVEPLVTNDVWVLMLKDDVVSPPAVDIDTVVCDDARVHSVELDGASPLWVLAEYTGSCTGAPSLNTGVGMFVLRYDTPQVAPLQDPVLIPYGAADTTLAPGGMALTTGGYVIAGQYQGAHVFSGPGQDLLPIDNQSGTNDLFVFGANAAGEVLWVETFVASDGVEVRDMAIDTSDNIVIGGLLPDGSTLTLGNLSSTSSTDSPFVAKLSASGTPLWIHLVETSGQDSGWGIAVDGEDTYFAGRATGKLDPTGDAHAGEGDIFAIKLSP